MHHSGQAGFSIYLEHTDVRALACQKELEYSYSDNFASFIFQFEVYKCAQVAQVLYSQTHLCDNGKSQQVQIVLLQSSAGEHGDSAEFAVSPRGPRIAIIYTRPSVSLHDSTSDVLVRVEDLDIYAVFTLIKDRGTYQQIGKAFPLYRTRTWCCLKLLENEFEYSTPKAKRFYDWELELKPIVTGTTLLSGSAFFGLSVFLEVLSCDRRRHKGSGAAYRRPENEISASKFACGALNCICMKASARKTCIMPWVTDDFDFPATERAQIGKNWLIPH